MVTDTDPNPKCETLKKVIKIISYIVDILCELLDVEGVLVSVLQVAKLGLHNNKL